MREVYQLMTGLILVYCNYPQYRKLSSQVINTLVKTNDQGTATEWNVADALFDLGLDLCWLKVIYAYQKHSGLILF